MLKKVIVSLLVVGLLTFTVSSGFAIVKGLQETKHSSLVKVGESVTVPQGAEIKSVVVVGGSITVYGQVIEDVVAVGGSVFLKDSAVVGGDVVAVGGKVMKEAGATSKGDVVEIAVGGISPAVSFFAKGGMLKGMAVFGLLNLVGLIFLSMAAVALFTSQLGKVSSNMETNLLKAFLFGLLIAILFIPVSIVLMVSIIGIVLIPVWAIIVITAGLFGYIAAGHLLGKKSLRAFKVVGKSMMIETLTGIIILFLIGLVPIGGLLVKAIAMLCGLGAVCQTRFGTKCDR